MKGDYDRSAASTAARPCGACSMCCTTLAIESLGKPAGVRCTHLGKHGEGCTIYDTRPSECSAFECVWLQALTREGENERARLMPRTTRPDRCHVLLTAAPPGGLARIVMHVNPKHPQAHLVGDIGRFRSMLERHGIRIVTVIGERRIFSGMLPQWAAEKVAERAAAARQAAEDEFAGEGVTALLAQRQPQGQEGAP